MVTCPNCGNQAGEGAVFCDQCGARLPAPASAPIEVPPPAAEATPIEVPPPAAEAAVPIAAEAAQAVEAAPSAAPAPAAAPAPVAHGGGSVICPSCGAGNVPGEAFCDFCGAPLDAPLPTAAPVEATAPAAPADGSTPAPAPAAGTGPTCPACGAEVQPDEAFCQNCGASLAAAPIPPEPVPDVDAEVEPAAPAEPATVPVQPAAPITVEQPLPVIPPAPPAPAPAEAIACPACGTALEPGDAFCSTCGFALKPPAAAAQPAAAPAPAAVPTAGGPRLVLATSGAEIPLPAKDEILVGREDPVSGIYPEVDLTPHGGEDGGVSRRHARFIIENGKYYVEDLDSTNFTFVNKQKVPPHSRQQVQPGDEVRFGRVAAVLQL